MKIAQVAPLVESVPPKLYGGTERVVSYLTEELVRRGHDVTLFASGDSVTAARLHADRPVSMRLDRTCRDRVASHVLQLEHVFQHASSFDIVHFHIDYLHYPLSRRQAVPQLTTLHGRLDIPELGPLYDEFRDMPLVSISEFQRLPLPQARWIGTVYHGLPSRLYRFRKEPGQYFAFLGRVSREKRLDRAIEIANRCGRKLKIAAKIDDADKAYVKKMDRLLQGRHVEFIGEIGDEDKGAFLGRAYALLFPVDWPEPFGLVLIEALACGTPVIAYGCGSVPEIITDGETGFIVSSIDEAVEAASRIPAINRKRCRDVFEERFSAERMASDYLALYQRVIDGTAPSAAGVLARAGSVP